MPNYRRAWQPGGTWFFTVTLQHRSDNDLLVRHIDALRAAVRAVAAPHPFTIDGWVVLPEHLHCILTLPPDDTDFAMRWRLIKGRFARSLPEAGKPSAAEPRRGERGIWQRRYWEHLVRDENDLRRHMDYLHFNPVKHGLVTRVGDWPYSTFHRLVAAGLYAADWGGDGAAFELGYPD